ncbi:MAG: serine/threonine-protein kinase [Isosphaeraceae bacterium]
MGSAAESSEVDRPVDRFSRLWRPDAPVPDVFVFLASVPGLSLVERLEILLADQRLRWIRGQPLPLRVYLSAFPDIAERGEMVRALVDGERHGRRKSAGRLNETILDPSPEVLLSETPTEAVDVRPIPELPEPGAGGPARVEELPTGSSPAQAGSGVLRSTRGPAEGAPTSDGSNLDFDLDERHHLRSEAEALRAMLDAVRFTLVRRLGTGGMGVVYEAYDQKRGELVALKTMRRVDPTALVRFKQEFRSLADCTHPNLVNLYELFAVDDRWFFTMELVEGTDFVSHVRSSAADLALRERERHPPNDAADGTAPARADGASRQFDEVRLRDALRQLAEGVEALHRSGKLHRDIKPTNVLVTSEGRVVLLDFGLTADLESSGGHRTAERQIVGTLAHMSPEQAGGLPIDAASDWYSVGVILFEAMTGRLPFVGPSQELIVAKQTSRPPSPAELVPNLPEDLVRLCVDLLARDPPARPSGREIIRRATGHDPGGLDPPERSRPLPLIGRSRHLQVLDSAFTRLARGRTQSIFVFGRTGTGKTTLIHSFLQGLTTHEEAVVLSGRCYERESVPYKALDNLFDALARYLRGLPARRIASILPPDVGHLARVFPVLEGVPAVATARREAPELPDPQELRIRAFSSLRELFRRLANDVPLVLTVDDLQWGDADSANLLADVLGATQAPVLLFLGSFRTEDAEECPFLVQIRRSITAQPSQPEHRELSVEALTQSEARELTLALLGRDDPVARAQAHVVARESGGNPLFIDELVKHIRGGGPIDHWEAIGRLDLDEVLWQRIGRQPEEARRLLGAVAVSGRPIAQATAFQATELDAGARVALASLRTARLIRLIGQADQEEIEIYHDRIRETIVAHLPPDRLRWHHERLAQAIGASGTVDPELLAGHYRGAGDLARAGEHYARGADQAAAALAFDHAARLYRTALDLHPRSPEATRALRRKLGDALANAGRGAEAAQAYLDAAASAPGDEALELKRLATTQLLISGDIDRGLSLLRTLLDPLGLRMPETPARSLISLVWHRAILRARGLRFRPRDEASVPARSRARIDLCWSAVAGLSMYNPIRGADFQARGLLLALQAGEPFRIARAIAMEAAHLSTAGPSVEGRVASLIGTASALADAMDSPHARGMVELVRGISSLLFGRWKAAIEALDRSERQFRDHCTGVAWERDTGHNLAMWALFHAGNLPELRRRWAILSREAQERGDRYAASSLNTFYATILRLAADEIPEIEAEIEATLAARHGRAFNLPLASASDAIMHIDLYRGDVTRAWARLGTVWAEYHRALLLRIQHLRIQMHELRARTAIAAAERSQQPAPLLEMAERDARRLGREAQPWAAAHAHYIRAAVAACREDVVLAADELAIAADLFDRADMPLHSRLMHFRLGEIQSSQECRDRRHEAERWLREQGIAAPTRWAGMLAPGFARISTESSETSY